MNTLPLRQRLVAIARKDVGQMETTRNQGPAMKRFWPATWLPEGYALRWPYCAAACCYWLQQWLLDPEVLAALQMTPKQAEKWRCKDPAAFGWIDWAKKKGLLVMDNSKDHVLRTGDFMVFDSSHIGIVYNDKRNNVYTIEANTSPGGSRDGEGIYDKDRLRREARNFIRLLPHELP